MSDCCGILYEPDDECRKVLEKIGKETLLPYHVIRTELETDTVYDVLYVSKYEEDWGYERPTPDGYVESWCWMENCQKHEMGTIKIQPVYGGLIRLE